jgi:hypothetical protein
MIEDNNFDERAIAKKVDTHPIEVLSGVLSRREVLRKSGRLAGALAVPSMVGMAAVSASSSAMAWRSWNNSNIYKDNDRDGAITNTLINCGILPENREWDWSYLYIIWRESNDRKWKDGELSVYDKNGTMRNKFVVNFKMWSHDGVTDLDLDNKITVRSASFNEDYSTSYEPGRGRDLSYIEATNPKVPLEWNTEWERLYNVRWAGKHVYELIPEYNGGFLWGGVTIVWVVWQVFGEPVELNDGTWFRYRLKNKKQILSYTTYGGFAGGEWVWINIERYLATMGGLNNDMAGAIGYGTAIQTLAGGTIAGLTARVGEGWWNYELDTESKNLTEAQAKKKATANVVLYLFAIGSGALISAYFYRVSSTRRASGMLVNFMNLFADAFVHGVVLAQYPIGWRMRD